LAAKRLKPRLSNQVEPKSLAHFLGEGGPAVLVGEGDSTNYMEAMKSLF
jgi:hypothetical protein